MSIHVKRWIYGIITPALRMTSVNLTRRSGINSVQFLPYALQPHSGRGFL
jgi:hypothetical protein